MPCLKKQLEWRLDRMYAAIDIGYCLTGCRTSDHRATRAAIAEIEAEIMRIQEPGTTWRDMVTGATYIAPPAPLTCDDHGTITIGEDHELDT